MEESEAERRMVELQSERMPANLVFSLEEIVGLLRVKTDTDRRLIRARKLHKLPICQIRFTSIDLDNYLDQIRMGSV